MKHYFYKLFIIAIFFLQCIHAYPIERGFSPGEIYFSSYWYWVDIGDRYNAIFSSNDYGQKLEIVYVCNIDAGDINPMILYRDKYNGVFYNVHPSKLYISYDHCSSWQLCPTPPIPPIDYAAGSEHGVVYRRYGGSLPGLYISTDYAKSFDLVKEDSVYGFIEVGTIPQEVYNYWGPSAYFGPFQIYYSINYGNSFSLINTHDSIVSGVEVYGNLPHIYRGVNQGELYLVSWFPPQNFKVFHSIDYGYSFSLRYESAECNLFYESYSFTPGNSIGEFYIKKSIPWFDGINTKVHILYSSDTAKTFTEYIHILDSNFPVNIYTDDIYQKKAAIQVYPNPFYSSTNAEIKVTEAGKYRLDLYNLSGQAVLRREQHLEIGEQRIRLSTETLDPGVYVFSVKSGDRILTTQKIIKAR